MLLPEDFTEYIYHVGNVSEMHSINRSGLIPGGKSLKRNRQSVFFTAVNPMEDENCVVETQCDLNKSRIAPYKKILETSSKHIFFGLKGHLVSNGCVSSCGEWFRPCVEPVFDGVELVLTQLN